MFLIVGNSHDDILFYETSLKNIREEREENPNIIKLIFTIVMAILLAIIVCVILVENNIIFLHNTIKRNWIQGNLYSFCK